jgi:hypothetical protein
MHGADCYLLVEGNFSFVQNCWTGYVFLLFV